MADDSRDLLLRDLASFRDPGTELQVGEAGSAVDIAWWQRGTEHEARFRPLDDVERLFDVSWRGATVPYKTFVAELAELDLLARTTARVYRPRVFVEPAFRLTEIDDLDPSMDGVLEWLQTSPAYWGRTQVLMITGDAGDGKTSVMKQVAYLGAQRCSYTVRRRHSRSTLTRRDEP